MNVDNVEGIMTQTNHSALVDCLSINGHFNSLLITSTFDLTEQNREVE
jgi:hypothetical protein